ncbi:MAG: winged helix DNA-binding protein [Betaproteobacteria bacterium]|nr:winged helix DNA-binding protein [Betaproteobacteria bacterium]
MLAVLGQFRIVIKSVRQHYQQVERKSGVSGAQLWALSHIAAHPGAKVSELAHALAIHASTTSNLIGRLDALALISRKRTRQDQRTVQLYATAKGANALKHAPRPLIGVLQQALSEVSERRLDTLHASLSELISAMKVKDVRARSATPLSDL